MVWMSRIDGLLVCELAMRQQAVVETLDDLAGCFRWPSDHHQKNVDDEERYGEVVEKRRLCQVG